MINRKVKMNQQTNLLELEEHMYPLVDVENPNVFRNLFPYTEVPYCAAPYAGGDLDHGHDVPRRSAVPGAVFHGADRDDL